MLCSRGIVGRWMWMVRGIKWVVVVIFFESRRGTSVHSGGTNDSGNTSRYTRANELLLTVVVRKIL
eukprot:scaffold19678_cov157-Amphora_coffeaeformis.AAC.1